MMRQKIKPSYYPKPSRAERLGKGIIVSLIVVLLFMAIGYYQYRHHPQLVTKASRVINPLQQWLSEHKNHLQTSLNHRIDKVKKVVKVSEKPDAVHFEFYSILPNMQIGEDGESNPAHPEESAQHVSRGTSKRSLNPLIFSQEDIDKDFAETVKHTSRG